ncbi:arginase [Aneurinibacillus migulanus]|jgi:arginase|uniref:Arginase n=1 Tax=Aneurinibacillus migulanus TaxID=47500 RepID=A0A0D1XYY7_ANEMI|nr:arginase [Aneurinibacillus migulanus]KIV57308.1 arginase [Aneurinibacillus migulanus]KIV60182.1 arginase [Aneurinibacillus migulanus]KON97241.1 arginase [Aneurinibacillus migulanus]KPD08638.1 arginase [Aneurinibacillus migulanus]MED0895883.1 arginase [Aneurinibacillus migulanus]
MNVKTNENISIIGVPMDLGADRRGVDMGPSAIRYAGIVERLESIGYKVHDRGDLIVRRPQVNKTANTNLKYLDEITRVNLELCETVSAEMEKGNFPLVIGGDHSIAIGTIAGVLQHRPKTGVIWYDAHGDMNTSETSPSGNIHGMSLAVSLGYGHESLTSIGGIHAKLNPEKTVLIGARALDPGEKDFIKNLGVKVYTMHEIDRLGMARVMEETMEIVTDGTDGVHLSLDLDGLDPHDCPGVGTPVLGGISYRESHLAMEILAEANVLTSAEFVEVNPILDQVNQTARVAVALMGSVFGEKLC